MNWTEPEIYEFGDFRLEVGRRLLLRHSEPLSLTPKAFETLLYLIRRQGQIVSKDELMRAVWPDTIVEENNLNQNISTIRRVLGESPGEHRYIATIPSKGYNFIAEVTHNAGYAEGRDERVVLAVLPCKNLSANPEHEYLADGMTEELIATLGQIDPDHLRVIGRTTMMSFKETQKTLGEIGNKLRANYLVESSMRSESDRWRITSALVQLPQEVQVWSMSYDGEPKSMLEFQREIGRAIGERVRLQFSPERISAIARRQTLNSEAYDLYLRGRYYWNQLSPATTRRASEFYAQAARVDPQYALAWSGLADAYTASPINGDAAPLAIWPLAREAVEHAIASDPGLAETQTSAGFVNFWLDWKWPVAVAAFRRAIDLGPHYSQAHRMLGIVSAHMGDHEQAREAMKRARELDPLLAGHHALSAQVAFMGRNYTEALKYAKQAVTLDPEFWVGHMQLGQAYEQLGEPDRALEALNVAARLSGGNSKPISLRGYLLAKTGRTDDANEVLRMLEEVAHRRYVPPYATALIHVALGRPDAALDSLERALKARDVHLTFLPVDPKWDPLRADERFHSILQRSGMLSR